MKNNYINQLQRDILVGFEEMGYSKPVVTESISIEDKAEKYANQFIGITSTQKIGITKDFIAGASEMLPIIKELGEALIKANLYVSPKFYGQGESYENEDYATIQTILEKYKNYL